MTDVEWQAAKAGANYAEESISTYIGRLVVDAATPKMQLAYAIEKDLPDVPLYVGTPPVQEKPFAQFRPAPKPGKR